MTVAVGDTISHVDYTTIKTIIDTIYGAGAGQSGYGQTITSPNIISGDDISHLEWISLRHDMVACRQHQNDLTVGSLHPTDVGYVNGENLIIPDENTIITAEFVNQYLDVAAVIETNKFSIGSTQYVNFSLDTQIRSTEWNNTLTHVITVTNTIDELRYFFNAGGTINFNAVLSGTNGTTKDNAWSTMLSNVDVAMDNHSTNVGTGLGIGSSIGFYDLLTTDQLIYNQDGPDATEFSVNSYNIYAKVDNEIAPSSIIFTIHFEDNDVFGADVNISGTLTSNITQNVPSTTNVSVTPLQVSYTSLTGAALTPTYSISQDKIVAKQAEVVTFNVHGSQVPSGTTLTWSIVSTTTGILATDFTGNTLSGAVTLNGSGDYGFTLTMASFVSNQDLKSFVVRVIRDGTTVVATTNLISIPPKGIFYYPITGTYTLTVPALITTVKVSGIGGGGGCYGWHDSGYCEHAWTGGPGGAVKDVNVAVNTGMQFAITVGKAGGAINGSTGPSGTGSAGTATIVKYNNVNVISCSQGGQGVYNAIGALGTVVINTANTAVTGGTLIASTKGSETSGCDGAGWNTYSALAFVLHNANTWNRLGTFAETLDPLNPHNGLGEMPGLAIISYE